ncbi:hypothetical protein JD77_02027 [Micromonospora olivasterospora]|uniref:Uncharacterized protein n=1 Tax=Micromonospora olivasterospora TaxID=1880 RepID=A0A562I8Q7_MICOL|nr:hypothetical protein JD77_02027 [Micromonospora olivasterospora]
MLSTADHRAKHTPARPATLPDRLLLKGDDTRAGLSPGSRRSTGSPARLDGGGKHSTRRRPPRAPPPRSAQPESTTATSAAASRIAGWPASASRLAPVATATVPRPKVSMLTVAETRPTSAPGVSRCTALQTVTSASGTPSPTARLPATTAVSEGAARSARPAANTATAAAITRRSPRRRSSAPVARPPTREPTPWTVASTPLNSGGRWRPASTTAYPTAPRSPPAAVPEAGPPSRRAGRSAAGGGGPGRRARRSAGRSGPARAPESAGLTTDAELWVSPADWAAARQRLHAILTELHDAARPPHAPGTVRVGATVLAFEMTDPAQPD